MYRPLCCYNVSATSRGFKVAVGSCGTSSSFVLWDLNEGNCRHKNFGNCCLMEIMELKPLVVGMSVSVFGRLGVGFWKIEMVGSLEVRGWIETRMLQIWIGRSAIDLNCITNCSWRSSTWSSSGELVLGWTWVVPTINYYIYYKVQHRKFS